MSRITVSDLLSEDDQNRLNRIVASGLTCSVHGLTCGGRRQSFSNLDILLADPLVSSEFVQIAVRCIQSLQARTEIDQLAYIDVSSRGPHALLTCRTEIASHTHLRSVIVRPDKRLHVAQIDGKIEPGDRIVFLCDALTTGHTMARAFGICARRQAILVCAVFVYDGLLAGTDELNALGLNTVSLVDPHSLTARALDQLSPRTIAALRERPAIRRQDLFKVAMAQI